MSNMNIQNAYEQVKKFNQIAGALTHENHEQTLDGIFLQTSINLEEAQEAYDAAVTHDAIGLLDGACDSFVTAAGLLQRLEAAGFNVEKALARVNQNNLDKLPTEFEFKQNPDLQPENTYVEYTPYGHVVFKRNLDGKVQKPTNFVPVDLVSCVPEDFFGVAKEAA